MYFRCLSHVTYAISYFISRFVLQYFFLTAHRKCIVKWTRIFPVFNTPAALVGFVKLYNKIYIYKNKACNTDIKLCGFLFDAFEIYFRCKIQQTVFLRRKRH